VFGIHVPLDAPHLLSGMSWQCICLPLKSYIVDVDDQAGA
jgi:hypothetical protein